MFVCLHNVIITLFFINNSLILFSHKNLSSDLYIFSFLLPQEKFFFSAKTLQFNLNYSHTRVFTFRLYDCLETESNRCNRTEVLLQGDFRLKSLSIKVKSLMALKQPRQTFWPKRLTPYFFNSSLYLHLLRPKNIFKFVCIVSEKTGK